MKTYRDFEWLFRDYPWTENGLHVTYVRDATPAWKAFNKKVGASGDVGVYRETYRVGAGRHESIYSNMPVMGLAAAGRSVVVGKRSETARARIARQ